MQRSRSVGPGQAHRVQQMGTTGEQTTNDGDVGNRKDKKAETRLSHTGLRPGKACATRGKC